MKVVITGGAGFIGANLGRTLLARPEVTEVVAVDDLSTGFEANLAGTAVQLHKATILDPDALNHAFAGASSVVHLAAIPSVPRSIVDPMSSHLVNATGTVEVLQAARRAGVEHIVVASSSSVYGANRELPKRETMRTDPISPYAVSKLATEMYALSFARSYGLGVLPCRFFNVYGAFQSAGHAYAAVTPNFVLAALTDEPLVVHGDGEQTRDFTYVGTLCNVIAEAVVRKVSYDGAMNCAFGTRTSLNEYIDELGEVVGRPLQVEYTEPRAGDVRDSQADTSRIKELFPDIEPVRLREGLEHTVDWYRSYLAAQQGNAV